MGVDEIHIGNKQKFLTVVCNLETGEPQWLGRDRKKETLDAFFQEELSARQRRGIEAVCADMWEPYRLSLDEWAPNCRIVRANDAIDEVRRILSQGLLSRWVNLTPGQRQEWNQRCALNRKVFKAYLLKESLDRLWTYHYEGAMLNYLERWIDQLRWQRLKPFQKLAEMLLDHLDGILNYCRIKVPPGVAERTAHGGDRDRIRGLHESGLKCGPVEFLRRAKNTTASIDARRRCQAGS
jgi:transposase